MGDILLSVSRYKAKKDHVCSCCGRKINKGEFYIREFGKADGEPFDSKLHNRCYSIKEKMINELCPDVYDWEEVINDVPPIEVQIDIAKGMTWADAWAKHKPKDDAESKDDGGEEEAIKSDGKKLSADDFDNLD